MIPGLSDGRIDQRLSDQSLSDGNPLISNDSLKMEKDMNSSTLTTNDLNTATPTVIDGNPVVFQPAGQIMFAHQPGDNVWIRQVGYDYADEDLLHTCHS